MKTIFFDFSTLEYAGGCEKNFMSLGRWLSKRGHAVGYVTGTSKLNNLYCTIFRQGKHAKNLSDSDLKDIYAVKQYTQFGLLDLFFPTRNRRAILADLRSADHIYSRNELFEAIILRYLLKVEPGKIIFGFHTPIFYPVTRTLKSKLHNWLYNSRIYLDLISDSRIRSLVLTTQDKKLLEKSNPNQQIAVIPNPINTDEFTQKKYSKNDTFSLYYIGRMTEQKGIDILCSAIENLSHLEEFKLMRFTFVGNGDKEKCFVELQKRYTNCHFLGFKSNVFAYYHDADVTIVPSRWEGFPYSVLEAQASGVPVIASDISGCRDIVKDKVTGWLCIPEDPTALSIKMRDAFTLWKNNSSVFEQMGINARKNILDNYTEEAINTRIESFLVKSQI